MPIWIPIIWIAAAVLVGTTGTVLVVKWDDIVLYFYGQKVAALGARGVGKTHLLEFLTKGSIPESYEQTLASTPKKGRRFALGELKLELAETLDVSGSKDAYGEWKNLFDTSDIVLYLLRIDHLLGVGPEARKKKYVEKRVIDDMKHIGKWRKKSGKQPMFFVVGTHCDLDPKFKNITAKTMGDYLDRILSLSVMKELVYLAGGSSEVTPVVGSMKNRQSTERIVMGIFKVFQDRIKRTN